MLKLNQEELDRLQKKYPLIGDMIRVRDAKQLPACLHCNSHDTAGVEVGIVGYSVNLAAASTKAELLPGGHKPGEYFCNGCQKYFGQCRVNEPEKHVDSTRNGNTDKH